MARSLQFWMAAPEASPLEPCDVPLALGTLLVHAAGHEAYRVLAQGAVVEAVLARRHDLTRSEAAEMHEHCERVASAAPELARLAALLQRAVTYRDRLEVARSLNEVLRADARLRQSESGLLACAETLLGVHPRDLAPPR